MEADQLKRNQELAAKWDATFNTYVRLMRGAYDAQPDLERVRHLADLASHVSAADPGGEASGEVRHAAALVAQSIFEVARQRTNHDWGYRPYTGSEEDE